MRRDFACGLMLEAAVGLLAVLWLEARMVTAGHLPGATAETAALHVLAAICAVIVLLAVPARAALGLRPGAALRHASGLCLRRWWVAAAAAAAAATGALLTWAFPPLIVLIAGPVGFALMAIHARASAPEHP
jgi:hypothetical protein